MDTSILEDIGLTQGEIKTYIALLEKGTCTAGDILEKSGLQNSVMHRALRSLAEKGLVSSILEGKRHIYQATDPTAFHDYLDDKRARFDKLLPVLIAKRPKGVASQASTYRGTKGITEVYRTMVSSKGEYLTFGGGKQCVERMGTAWWMNVHAKRVHNKLPSRQVFDKSVQTIGMKIIKLPKSQIRYLGADFASFQETVIAGDRVAVSIFTEEPYALLIKDKNVADSYKKHFELLWKQAKK